MALRNVSTDHTADEVSVSVKLSRKTIRKAVLAFGAVLVLAAAVVVGLTLKERVTDPAIDKAGTALSNVVEDTTPDSPERRKLESDVLSMCSSFYPADKAEVVDLSNAQQLAKEYSSAAKYTFLADLSPEEAQEYVFIKFSNADSRAIKVEIFYREMETGVFNRMYPSE